MNYPQLTPLPRQELTTGRFLGYNHHLRIADGEFYHMENLSSREFPLLAPRKKRGLYRRVPGATALLAKDKLCYTQGGTLVIGDEVLDLGLAPGEKQLLSMGAYLLIFPDKVYVNTADLSDRGSLDHSHVTAGEVKLTMTRLDGTDLTPQTRGAEPPQAPEAGALWLDTGGETPILKQYSATLEGWIDFTATYVRLSAPGIGSGFGLYDGITLRGLPQEAGVEENAVIWDRGEDFITLPGLLPDTLTVTQPITLERKMPQADFVIECRNRLWACRYGPDSSGQMVNRLYASRLGDFKNWHCYLGAGTDSYYVNLGTDGPFTGATGAMGYPLFFKEGCLHRVYGDLPSEFAVQDQACRGVQAGCHGSLATVNETLFYKSRHGICAYDGSLPQEVSAPLGEVRYHSAAAGVLGSRYYISMEEEGGKPSLFVFDAERALWHREDDLKATSFAPWNGDLYALAGENILALGGSGEDFEGYVPWLAETGILATDLPGRKFITELTVRMSMDVGGRVRFFLRYDSMGSWVHAGTVSVTSLRSFSLPIRPRRCDHLQLRIQGTGEARIHSITQRIEEGGDPH